MGSRNRDVAERLPRFVKLSDCCPLFLFCVDTSNTAWGNPEHVKSDPNLVE